MKFATAELCDAYPDKIEVATPGLRHYGGCNHFLGTIATVRCHEDNTRVRELLAGAGAGQVLVVDGGGSTRCALLGDRMAAMAIDNEWHGVIIHGCVRDTAALSQLPLGICALGSNPHRSAKKGAGETAVPVRFAGINFTPGAFVYADSDGILVSTERLL